MKESKKVIRKRYLPVRLPVSITITIYLLMDKFNAPGWLWGCIITIAILWWTVALLILSEQEECDISELVKREAKEQPEHKRG